MYASTGVSSSDGVKVGVVGVDSPDFLSRYDDGDEDFYEPFAGIAVDGRSDSEQGQGTGCVPHEFDACLKWSVDVFGANSPDFLRRYAVGEDDFYEPFAGIAVNGRSSEQGQWTGCAPHEFDDCLRGSVD